MPRKRARRPLVSVVVPACDQLGFLRQAVESVRGQSLRDLELILVDDASEAAVSRWARRCRWPRLRLVTLPRRRGTAAARNAALALARGRLVAFLDHDDLWAPRYLETLAARFEDPRVMMAASNVAFIDASGKTLLGRAIGASGKIDAVFESLTGLRGTPCMSACVFRRRVFTELGALDEGFSMIDDLDLFYRTAYRYGRRAFAFVDEPLAAYRVHAAQQTAVYRGIRGDTPRLLRELLGRPRLAVAERACLLDAALFYSKHVPMLKRRGLV